MTAPAHLPLDGLYQLGFTTRDLERAQQLLGERYGISRWRVRQPNPRMRTAHAYAGESMIELIEPSPEGDRLYLDHMPQGDGVARLHHLGRRIADAQAWERLEQGIAALGLAVPMGGSVMEGDLHYAYVDTRADLGIYSEYVWLQGKALSLYDDIPRD
ncbi:MULTISPECIES: VOC family protein [unclassified Sphingobium]|uniref:VOC family protein n=1 Tax=unclassified Sphingobium TaxID=2611147 RepID=UPI00119C3D7C|nr:MULTISPECIES: VOC family protein [unclassified Sphingobium]MBG6120136.1 hypothetical protein [Sphingobium sp. JAI105]TWD05663.1 glyoxalase/bleomycin resistance protein/dioxygenase superfamily protein [Sphingobium sp. AEW010]TWD23216.1 glyoxalase/bleomycin resistance protein/dioxygenase superfamily protein [Sphingobium sp. AEW013]TWD25076.1 glyoxalase/bleomycin resistance protein/dioxygenase superfamily protein [Sphingobium sp. AEW001]